MVVLLLSFLAQNVDLDAVRARADALLEEAKAAYESARTASSLSGFVEAGFKLEEARIKYLVLLEIGQGEVQKTASDRLRAVNQLNKLIKDGRVAIQKPPPETPSAPTASPGAAPAPPAAVPPPAAPAPAVTARASVPDVAQQREVEGLVRNVFKEHYAKKSPVDRQTLSRMLLEQAEKSADKPVERWVLYREAQDVAIQICDVPMIVAAVEATSRMFDVDGLALKNAALTAAGKFAKSPAEAGILSEALLRLVDELMAADQYDDADKVAAAAHQHARRANDAGLLKRNSARTKEVAEAKSKFQTQKKVLETLAKSPDDPAANNEFGQFLCFVKSNWDLGVRFLAKGSDTAFRGLAEREIAADMATAADGWFDHAQREKSTLRKSQMLQHARELYERALIDATGLARAKIEKRLSDIGAGDSGDPGPAAHWRFDEKAGTLAADAVGRCSLTLSNGASWSAGRLGGALSLDGRGARATASDPRLGNADNGTLTIACFIKVGTPMARRLLSKIDVTTPGEARGWVIDVNTGLNAANVQGSFRLRLADGPGHLDYVVHAGFPVGTWKHLAVVLDLKNEGARFYVDGEPVGPLKTEGSVSGTLACSTPLVVGWIPGQTTEPKYYQGEIDDLRFYRRPLTPAEVKELAGRK